MKQLIWVGNKMSDVQDISSLFAKTINLYGQTDARNRCFEKYRCNNNANDINVEKFLKTTLEDEISKNDYKIMFYNPQKAYMLGEFIKDKTMCLNDKFILSLLDDKITCHDYLISEIKFAPYITMLSKYISYKDLKRIFPFFKQFVIQLPKGSGGFNTYLLTQESEPELLKILGHNTRCLVSGYVSHNFSFNAHIIIGKHDYIIFPPSKQIIQVIANRLIYRGADFINIPEEFVSMINRSLIPLILKLQHIGYCGILGADLIIDIDSNQIYLAELNCRFQGSSFLLNKALLDLKLPSLQELNMLAFNGTHLSQYINNNLPVPYGCVFYYQNIDSIIEIKNSRLLYTEDDSLSNYNYIEPFSYLFKKVYTKS